MSASHPALRGITVLERGWLSSNNILIHAAADEQGATLIDSGHVSHAEQTVQLVRHALAGRPLARLLNTHLHSDHCGGNAALQRSFAVPTWIPPGQAEAVRAWDEDVLSYRSSGQHIEAFRVDAAFAVGQVIRAGGRDWQVLAAPGHDPHSVMFFDAAHGLLISADALWENGFGVVFPEVVGEPGFDDVGATLDLIASLPVRLVVPGHGAPFTAVEDALARARLRLQALRDKPERHLRHAAKVFIKYHVMEERAIDTEALHAWMRETRLMAAAWRGAPDGHAAGTDIVDWGERLLAELVATGALARDGQRVVDR